MSMLVWIPYTQHVDVSPCSTATKYQQPETEKWNIEWKCSILLIFSQVFKNTPFITKFIIMIDQKHLPDNTDQNILVYICIRLA